MMLAVWSLATALDLRTLNPLRTLMVAAANGVAVLCFAATGNVAWREALVAMVGGVAGGYLGAHYGRRLPAPILRAVILTIAGSETLRIHVLSTRGDSGGSELHRRAAAPSAIIGVSCENSAERKRSSSGCCTRAHTSSVNARFAAATANCMAAAVAT